LHCAASSTPLLQRILFSVGEKAVGFEAQRTAEGGDEGDVIAGGGDAATPGGLFRTVMRRMPPFPAFGKRGDIVFR
jgi:hypothetical protein